MDISTGGGTLVHEMVHPYIDANLPDAPPWVNEGMASLYEHVREKDGRIYGNLNWRLPGLQSALAADDVPSFKWLTSQSTDEFYGEDPGTNYSQSRYLCYYLQEKGLLRQFYQELEANIEADPTGYATLRRVLGEPDMHAFQKGWEAWVLKLPAP
jgi:hypothetical protein